MSNEIENVSRRRLRRRYGFGAFAIVAALVLAGCSDDDSPTTEPSGRDSSVPMSESPMDESPSMDDMDESPSTDDDMDDDEAAAPGVYRDYTDDAVGEDGYDRTILFFHAEWCPECRAFEAALKETEIPEGLQILKVDYDTADDLKTKHEVTIQTTFVEVDDDGEQLSSWVGYEKDRSLDTILEGLG